MESIFKEKTTGAISGTELKNIIVNVADEYFSEGDYESAAIFYKTAAELKDEVMYKKVVKQEFFEFESAETGA